MRPWHPGDCGQQTGNLLVISRRSKFTFWRVSQAHARSLSNLLRYQSRFCKRPRYNPTCFPPSTPLYAMSMLWPPRYECISWAVVSDRSAVFAEHGLVRLPIGCLHPARRWEQRMRATGGAGVALGLSVSMDRYRIRN